ncbi:MAG TPA: hypothetical protein VD932_03195 [Aquabacterium sp.]|nr:hypothetical protein [Aquabacterium sp.]
MKRILLILGLLLVLVSSAGAAEILTKQSGDDDLNTDGSALDVQLAAPEATYSAAVAAAYTPAATPTDIFTITGSASRVVEVRKVWLSTTQTTAGQNAWFIVKRSSANSGGTSQAVTAVAHDSLSQTATATVLRYAASNPTLGTEVGKLWSGHVTSPAPATAEADGYTGTVIDLCELFGKPVTLRGTGQVLAISFEGAALPAGLSVLFGCTWSERALE